jgi:hypothetical protein
MLPEPPLAASPSAPIHEVLGIDGADPEAMGPPLAIRQLAEELFASEGVEAVVVGGSRATGDEHPDSDWDLGVYYRIDLDLRPLSAHGEVHPPGSWGRLMNGGAWLDVGGGRVDVLLRDLAVVEHWTREAQLGRYEVDGLLGYVAGLPTYSLTAEATFARPLCGTLAIATPFPTALASTAPPRWRFCRDFSLHHAEMHAAQANVAGAVGQAARAVLEEAHARACEQQRWVLNEKRLVRGCGLDAASALLSRPGRSAHALTKCVSALRDALHS